MIYKVTYLKLDIINLNNVLHHKAFVNNQVGNWTNYCGYCCKRVSIFTKPFESNFILKACSNADGEEMCTKSREEKSVPSKTNKNMSTNSRGDIKFISLLINVCCRKAVREFCSTEERKRTRRTTAGRPPFR